MNPIDALYRIRGRNRWRPIELATEGGDPAAPHDHDAQYAALAHQHEVGDAPEHDHDYAASHEHPDLATSASLSAHEGTAHGLTSHALEGAYHTGTDVLPTPGQKNALAGTNGTPGLGNEYVTATDARLTDRRDPTAHEHPYAAEDHGHDAVPHEHDYADPAHDHDTRHDHDGQYAAPHAHPFAADDHSHGSHTHDYAASGHTHAGAEAFPVGSVFLSVVSTDPGTLLGYGTWVAFGAGRMLMGRDAGQAAEDTGGSSTHTHAAHTGVLNHTHGVTVTDPGHTHDQGIRNTGTAGTAGVQGGSAANNATVANAVPSRTTGISATTANPAGGVASIGHDSPSHLPPYIVVYAWKRTA